MPIELTIQPSGIMSGHSALPGLKRSASATAIILALTAASAASAADYHYVASSDALWGQFGGTQWGVGIPGPNDRAIFDLAGTGSTYTWGSARSVGQIVFLAPYTGFGFVNTPVSTNGLVSIGGIDGLGVVSQVNQAITLSERITLTGSQEWRIDSQSGSISQLSKSGAAALNLGAQTLTLNPVQSGNAFYLNNPISGTGGLVVTGAGTVYLIAANTYSGGTVLNGGTLSMSSDANLGSVAGALSINGGVLQITGTGFNSTGRTINWGANGGGFDIADASNNFAVGQALGGGPLTKLGAGSLTLTGANSFTGATTIQSGRLALTGAGSIAASSGVRNNGVFDISGTAAGASIRTLSGSGVVATGAQTLTLTAAADTFAGRFEGTGALVLAAGHANLTGDSSGFGGATTIQAGALSVNGILGGTLAVQGGRLQGIGTVGTTMNAAGGTIAPGNSIGTLTINGNYRGNGGRLEIETVLGGDASPSDRLVITGSSAGSTLVNVLNQGGTGAPTVEGIKIVDVGGASNGSFTLANGDYAFQGQPALIAGAYAYTLQHNGVSTPNDGDWYLRSAYVPPAAAAAPVGSPARTVPILQPGVPVYEAYGQVLQSLNGLPTLRQRVGDRMHGDGTAPAGTPESQAIWARIEGAHSRITPRLSTSGTSYEIDSWRLQAGLEGQLLANGAGTLVGGLTAHHGGATADIASVFGRGKIATSGTGFGGTLTWYGESGLYADAQAQASWFDSDLSSTTLGRRLADGTGGFGYAFGLELGQRIALNGAWSLTPQAQLIYSRVTADSFTDPFGARVSLGDGDSLKGRLGLAADYRSIWRDSAGQLVSTTLYGIANLSYEFLDDTTASVAGTRFSSAEERLWGGVGLGAKYDWGRYSLYGEASVRTSLAQFADSHELSGRAGFRMSW